MLSLCNYILFWLQLQKCGKVNVSKTRKSKKKVKQELIRSRIEHERYENKDPVSVIRAYKEIIKRKKLI